MMTRNGLILIATLSVFALMLLSASFMQIRYYSEFNMFGPISKYAIYFFMMAFLPALTMIFVLRNRKVSPAIILIPFLLLVLLKYVIPDLSETFYATNFSDVQAHLRRGLFVTKTGYSDIGVDLYFDMQPGFFWATSVILNLVYGVPSSVLSPISLFLAKWFHLLAFAAYLPLLYLFYKKLLGNISLVGGALLLQFALDTGHYHYAAQPYGNLLYWLALSLVLLYSNRRDLRFTVLLLVSGFSLIFLHQGLVIFLLVLIAAMIFYPSIFRIIGKKSLGKTIIHSKSLWIPFAILFTCWLSYLMFLTVYTFEDFVTTLRAVVQDLVAENIGLISTGIQRPNPIWMEIVTCKAAYIGALVLIGIILSFKNARRTNDDVDKAVFTIQLFTAIIMGTLSVSMGGAGYIERLLLVLPLVTYSIIKYILSIKWRIRKISTSAATTIVLALVIFLGMSFFFSGRNFQSMTYTELAEEHFVVIKDPNNVAGLYTRMLKSPLSTEITYGFYYGVLYELSPHDTIYCTYYITGESSKTSIAYMNLTESNDQIYDNSFAKIIRSPNP